MTGENIRGPCAAGSSTPANSNAEIHWRPWNNATRVPILRARKPIADRRTSFLLADTVRDDGLPFQKARTDEQGIQSSYHLTSLAALM